MVVSFSQTVNSEEGILFPIEYEDRGEGFRADLDILESRELYSNSIHAAQHPNCTRSFIVIIIIIIIILLSIFFVQCIYTYIPETNHVPRENCVATILM